ncbi:MAG: hypothetical protein WAL90_09805 [Desulfobacterales bacterium]
MIISGGNGDDIGEIRNLDRSGLIIRRAVTNLTIAVISPGPYTPVRFQGQAMRIADSYRGYIGESGGQHRHVSIRIGSVTQSAIVIVSPGPHVPIRLQGQAVMESGGYGDNIGKICQLDRKASAGRSAIADLPIVI